jgi:hypothetical protein
MTGSGAKPVSVRSSTIIPLRPRTQTSCAVQLTCLSAAPGHDGAEAMATTGSLVGQISCAIFGVASLAPTREASETSCAKSRISQVESRVICRPVVGAKIFRLRFSEIYDFHKEYRTNIEGRFGQSSRNVGRGMQWTPGCRAREFSRTDERHPCGRQNRVVLTPLGWR